MTGHVIADVSAAADCTTREMQAGSTERVGLAKSVGGDRGARDAGSVGDFGGTGSARDAEGSKQAESVRRTKRPLRAQTAFQAITLATLPLFWAGYGYALYCENAANLSSYSIMILAFSLLNANILFTGEKAANRVLNVLAKLDGVLFFAWAVLNIVLLMLK